MGRDIVPLIIHHSIFARRAAGLVTVLMSALALGSHSSGKAVVEDVAADAVKEARAAGAAGSELSSRLN